MSREAELFDGTVLEFEDGTPDDVITRVAREQTDRIRTEQARVTLPAGVEPSAAGAGRGRVAPPAVDPKSFQNPQARRGTMRAVDPYQAQGEDTELRRGGPLADERAMRAQPVPGWGEPGAPEVPQSVVRLPPAAQREAAARARLSGADGASPELKDAGSFVAPTGGVMDAVREAPGMAARALGESALTAGAVLADYGITMPGGPSAEEFRRAAKPLKERNRSAAMGLNDEALVNLGPLITSVVPSARTLGEGLSEVGKQVVLNVVLPGGIIADAGFQGVSEAQMAGMSPGGALLIGLLKAGTEGVPEHFSAKFNLEGGKALRVRGMLSDPKIAVEAVKRFGMGMGVELSTEQASAVGNWAVDKLARDPTATLDRLATDMTDAIKATLIQAPGMMAAGKIAAGVQSLGRKITSYDIAASRGFNVDPPLTTDPPDKQRTKTVKVFQAAASVAGIEGEAVKRAVKEAESMPLEQAGKFFGAFVQALGKRGGVAQPLDPAVAETLAAGPVEPAPEPPEGETKQPVGETKPAKPATAAQEAVSSIERTLREAGALEDDGTGLSEPAAAVVAAAQRPPSEAREFEPFDDATGTLKVPRAEMPQVKAGDRSALVQFLRARGVDYQADEEVAATDLKPTQAEFSPAKVQQAREFSDSDRSILVSSDGYVLDGHHQWLAKLGAGEPVKAIRLNAPIQDLLRLTHEFPSSTTATEATSGPAQPDLRPPAAVAEAPPAPGGDQPTRGGRTVGPVAADAGGAKPAATAAPAPSVRAPEPVAPGGAGAAAVGPRVIARIGATPKQAEPLELRTNDDGTLTPVLGGNEVLDFETAEPIKIPAGSTDQQAIEQIKSSGALGRRQKVYGLKAEGASDAAQEVAEQVGAGGKRQGDDGGRAPAGSVVRSGVPGAARVGEPAGQEAAAAPVEARKNVEPKSKAEAVAALERGDRVMMHRGTEFEETTWIEETRAGGVQTYVIKQRSSDTGGVVTKGPVGPDRKWGWGRGDAAQRAADSLGIVESAAPAELSPERIAAAFDNDYASFEGRTLEQRVQLSDTGQVAVLRIDAAKAMRSLDARLKAIEGLRACIGRTA